jgi:hypothetical protein
MKKLKLRVEELRVESFAPREQQPEAGTVMAYASTGGWWQCQWQCINSEDCDTVICTLACQESIDLPCG